MTTFELDSASINDRHCSAVYGNRQGSNDEKRALPQLIRTRKIGPAFS